MNSLLIGDGHWGGIIKPKLKQYTNLIYTANSKSNLRETLRSPNIETVFVCTPTDTHYEIVKLCLEENKKVFCEKPFTGDYNLAKKLYSISNDIFIDNLFLLRREYIDLRSNKFTDISFIWNKKDKNLKENLYNSLLYHDLYMLIEMTNEQWEVTSSKVTSRRLSLELKNGSKTAHFKYDRDTTPKEKKIIIDGSVRDFSNPQNDPLKETILSMVDNSLNYESNRDITLKTLFLLNKIQ